MQEFSKLDRRQFLGHSSAAGLSALYPGLLGKKNGKRPNILLIMSDEHNQRVAGCYGNTVVKTPNIDALAASGITFENHYCNSPLCVPSRSSFTAGKYASRVDVWDLSNELPRDDMPSIARSMNAAGYESFLCGKMHYEEGRRYGFTEVGGDFNRYPKDGLGKRMTPAELKDHTVLSQRFREFATRDDGSTVKHDLRVTAGAVDFLEHRKSDAPFFLLVGYLAPHFPLIVPEPFYAQYKDKVPAPHVPEGFVNTLPTNYKLERVGFHETDVPQETVKFGRELYYGLTSWMDNQVGQVLAALRKNPELAENTIIIYTSDHGENMGEHSLWWKNSMYDQAARVPLVVSWPQRWKGGQRRKLASGHVDLVKTIVDLGGGQSGADWNGDSMLPWLDNAKHTWKDQACSEYYAKLIAHGFAMIRTGKWKYVYHGRPAENMATERQLFDMQADPEELSNLAAEPRYAALIAELHTRLEHEVGGSIDETEQRARKQLATGYPGKVVTRGGGEDGA
ncbi:sulfatase-like hydrolase/transferase [Granulicella cerasi]|uniref:Sulfatase-like hydrolase/transferase n=1 Tax=Granulicella cerasi TaxID=741063 RepID=A0ABW1ZBN7_9BACT|nr:sulfatase-like hydrolase/transferase [Granulicella cerasi]